MNINTCYINIRQNIPKVEFFLNKEVYGLIIYPTYTNMIYVYILVCKIYNIFIK